METHFHVFLLDQQYFERILREHRLELNLLELSLSLCLAIAKELIHVRQPLAMAKRATFLQNIL